MLSFINKIRKNWALLRTPSSHVIIDKVMIKKTGRTSHSIMASDKPIKKEYKLFIISDEGYIYNYL